MHANNTAKITLAILSLITGLGMIMGVWWMTRPVEESASQTLSKQLATLISVEEEANRAAIMRAESDLRDNFRTYANRTPQFAEAVTEWKHRFKIAFHKLKDWWSDANEVQSLTAELFAQHVVSDKQSVDDLKKIISQFQSDLASNRNLLLSEAALRIREADLGIPDLRLSQNAMLARLSDKEQKALSLTVGNSPWNSLLSFSGSVVAGEGMQLLVVQVIRIASGSVITGATGGGGTGTAVAPGVGTVIGITVGLVVGIAVDYWMTKRTTIKIEEEARRTLDAMRDEIWSNPTDGLKVKFEHLVELTRTTHEQVLRNVVSEEKP